MNNKLFVWKQNIACFPDEDMVTHLDMDKLLAWSMSTREYWQQHGPAPTTWKKENFPLLRIWVSDLVPVPDHLRCGSVKIVSPKLKEVVESSSVPGAVEFYPVTVVHGKNSLNYFFYNVLAVEDPVDYERSELVFLPVEDGGGTESINRLLVNENFNPSSQIFVMPEMPTLTVVNVQVKTAIEVGNCTGSLFVALDGYDDLWMTRPGIYRF